MCESTVGTSRESVSSEDGSQSASSRQWNGTAESNWLGWIAHDRLNGRWKKSWITSCHQVRLQTSRVMSARGSIAGAVVPGRAGYESRPRWLMLSAWAILMAVASCVKYRSDLPRWLAGETMMAAGRHSKANSASECRK